MLELEVLILELLSVDGLAAAAVAIREVAALNHELRDDAVEGGSLVVERLALVALTLFASAQSAEVLGRLGDSLAKKTHGDAASSFAINRYVEEYLVGDGGTSGRCRSDESGE